MSRAGASIAASRAAPATAASVRHDHPLVRKRGARDHGGGGLRGPAVGHQRRARRLDAPEPHVEDDGPVRGTPAGSSGAPSSLAAWAVASVTLEEQSRCVSGIPVLAAAPSAAEIPGTTSNGTRAALQLLGLLSAPSEDERIAALEPHHVPALERAKDDESDGCAPRGACILRRDAPRGCARRRRARARGWRARPARRRRRCGAELTSPCARTVSSSGSPGPAPTSQTLPLRTGRTPSIGLLMCSPPPSVARWRGPPARTGAPRSRVRVRR